jgi:hypothetical protein
MITMFWFTALGRRMVLRACDGLLAPFRGLYTRT